MNNTPNKYTEPADTIRVQLTFPVGIVSEPIVYELISRFEIIPNIRRANLDVKFGGFLFLELTGKRENLGRAIAWMREYGIDIDAIGLDGTQEWAI